MANQIEGKIKHIVVLMFENRSFDHLLGALPGVNGVLVPGGDVNTDYYNTVAPLSAPGTNSNPPLYPTPIDLTGQSGLYHDFNHDFGDGMMPDLFGPGTTGYLNGSPVDAPATTYPATNSGFLSTIAYNAPGQPANGPSVMYFFEYGSMQILHKLATEFVVCDNWHCDLPGHTQPNRCLMHCASCASVGIDDNNGAIETGLSIYDQLDKMGFDWKMYTPGGWLDSTFIASIANNDNANVPLHKFCDDIKNGTLPFYSFLMPGLSAPTDTSMHPFAKVEAGENYLAAVYNQLRNSDYWENTLLIVNFDENGGIYDHVVPPQTVPPDPSRPVFTGTTSSGGTCEFDFTLLGPRIPAILISPWLSKGIDSTLYQNTSILRYVQDLIVGTTEIFLHLTDRDAQATSIERAFGQFGTDTPRTDCTNTIEMYPGVGGGNICDPDAFKPTPEYLQAAPEPYTISLAKEYLGILPGHPDSGKPFNKTFATNAELWAYAEERIAASKKFIAENMKKG